MRIRDDIDLDKTWITSDSHFGHDNIVGFCHRPEDHEQVMIAEWRAHVPDEPGTTLLHLGDLAYRGNARFKHLTAKELTPSTSPKGKITPGARRVLIKGNHDHQSFKFYKDCGFKLARPFALDLAHPGDGRLEVIGSEAWPYSAPSRYVRVSFAHYPWGPPEDEEEMNRDWRKGPIDWRVHGHIHNNGYARSAFIPFLRNHINISAEQTKYRPINLRALLEGAILGVLPPQADEDRLQEAARQRSIARRTERKPS